MDDQMDGNTHACMHAHMDMAYSIGLLALAIGDSKNTSLLLPQPILTI